MSKKLSTLRRGSVQVPPRLKFKENSRKLPKIIVIVGPTASGKTDLSIKLARKLNGEVVSADSRQIYRGMDVGTAKPPRDQLPNYLITDYYSGGIPHHLINIKNPDQPYTVAQYKKDCLKAIRDILKRKKIPIVVGGTGLYIKAVIDNLDIPKIKPNLKLREKLEKELQIKNLSHLYQKLIKLDPEAAYIIDRQNPRRVIRALEITLTTNKPFSQQRKMGKKLFNSLKIGVNPPKQKLKARIEKRVDQIIKGGLIDEVKNLIRKYPFGLPALDAIGYREIINYLQSAELRRLERRTTQKSQHQSALNLRKSALLQEAIDLMKRNTWHYAKRQMTWFGKDREIKWIDNPREAKSLIKKFLANLR